MCILLPNMSCTIQFFPFFCVCVPRVCVTHVLLVCLPIHSSYGDPPCKDPFLGFLLDVTGLEYVMLTANKIQSYKQTKTSQKKRNIDI